jgi:PhoH-like ATPase
MRKIYILDTSVLIDDPSAYTHFMNSDVIIPIIVINELDKKKVSPGEVGRNARVCCRLIDKASDLGDISTGVLLDNDILLKVDATYFDLTEAAYKGFGAPDYADTQILACVYNTYKEHPEDDVTLVSNDINLRIKAKARGVNAIEHEANKCSLSDLYAGIQVIKDEDVGLDIQKKGCIDPATYGLELNPNECAFFEDVSGGGLALARKVAPDKLKLIKKVYPWNLTSRNKEQSFAIDLIMDKSIDLVTLIGKAGTGKSLVVLAAALELVINRKEYEKFIIYRPIQPVGSDIGFLPGTMEEKLAPWFQAIMDNFETLFQSKNGGDWRRELEMYQKKGKIEMEAITYIRGRSIPNAIILLDECQNLSKEDVKTVLTRAGENTKIILTGDIEQIDNSVLDATSNGLTYVIEKFKNSDLAGHITFTQGERSKLATLASEIL